MMLNPYAPPISSEVNPELRDPPFVRGVCQCNRECCQLRESEEIGGGLIVVTMFVSTIGFGLIGKFFWWLNG